MSLLDDDDLAYMRTTQAETRPTAASLYPRASVPNGLGGATDHWPADDGQPVRVRIVRVNNNTAGDDVPQDLASKYGASALRKVVCDLTPVKAGDLLHDEDLGRWYEVVSTVLPEEWTTALILWATRTEKRTSA